VVKRSINIYRLFAGSLRKSGFHGTVILSVESDFNLDVQEYLNSKDIAFIELNFTECDKPIVAEGDEQAAKAVRTKNLKEANTCISPYSDVKIRWGRYPKLRDALRDCKKCTGPVLTHDARDVVFQRDLFGTEL
jgi:hypothetical protein